MLPRMTARMAMIKIVANPVAPVPTNELQSNCRERNGRDGFMGGIWKTSNESSPSLHFRFQPVHDQIRHEIGEERDGKEQHTDQKQNPIMRTAEYGFAQLGRDR